jgi:hypothetical protein
MSEMWNLGSGKQAALMNSGEEKQRASCLVPECRKEFAFELGEMRVFDLPLLLFERRHFYRSELS